MPVAPELRQLDIDVPAQPDSLVKLSLLMAEDDFDLAAASDLIETDMALAAAVMKAVNSSLYGLKGRVQAVLGAVQYLGMREVAAITYEMGLRAAFPPSPVLEPLWRRAAMRGLLMGRMAQQLGLDAWAAHSAGLFEECGKAVLYRHASDHYPALLRAARDDGELATLERAAFGVSHDALGAALCETWGLGPNAVISVRHHVAVQAGADLPSQIERPAVLALSVVAQALLVAPDTLQAEVARVAPQVPLDVDAVLRVARQTADVLAAATAHGRQDCASAT